MFGESLTNLRAYFCSLGVLRKELIEIVDELTCNQKIISVDGLFVGLQCGIAKDGLSRSMIVNSLLS
jgi:hypothetical protein